MSTATTALSCRDLVVRYDDEVVIDHLRLEVASEETVAVLGPSGSGKTTLLYAVAGFVEPASGVIEIGGRTVVGGRRPVPPEDRDVGFVFQHYALWPHLDALDTVAYPLRRRGIDLTVARERAAELLDLVGIGDLAGRRPSELSGGQQQRVGIARALAREPALYLLDEPTAHLDAPLRAALQDEIGRIRAEVGTAAILATHDAQEALSIADRVVLVRAGRIVQTGSPSEVYERPVDRWAAELTGPAAIVEAQVRRSVGTVAIVSTDDEQVEVAIDGEADGIVDLVIRPEWTRLGGPLPGVVRRSRYRGAYTDHVLETSFGEVVVRASGDDRLRAGERVGWTLERAWSLGAPQQAAAPLVL